MVSTSKSSLAAAAALVWLSLDTAAQAVYGFQLSWTRKSTSLSTRLGITSEEILARARKASGVPEEESAPKIFDDSLLNDMQSALLKLEHRVKEGPGSLSILDAEELQLECQRIIDDMHRNAHRRIPKPSAAAAAVAPSPVAEPVVQQWIQKPAVAPAVSRPTTTTATSTKRVTDTSFDEGPAYDGRGGMGQPKGTVNTYVIDGMDEMSPSEYQKALQDSIIERQRQRRMSGMTTGNKATWDYLNSLKGGSSSGPEGNDSVKDSFKPFGNPPKK